MFHVGPPEETPRLRGLPLHSLDLVPARYHECPKLVPIAEFLCHVTMHPLLGLRELHGVHYHTTTEHTVSLSASHRAKQSWSGCITRLPTRPVV